MTEERVKRKLSAILSADVVGYSRLMGEDEVSTVRTLEAYRKVMSDLIEQFRGRVVDSPGDNLLSEFSSVVDAVQCAVEIHEVIRAKNEELREDRRMLFRIGVNLGDVIEEGDRIYGDGVNIAARLEGLAEAGGICISGSAHEQIKNKLALGYEYIGEHTVKNITEPLKVYRVPVGLKSVTSKEEDEKKIKSKKWQWIALGAAGALIIIGALTIWNFYLRGLSIESDQAPVIKEAPKTIAVLPFVNLSPDPEQEYFVDGLSEEIINSLTQIPNLGVTGRTSSFTFKGSNKKTQEIANELGVDHVLEGSVRKAGTSLRITAQLIRAADDLHLWSENYDHELKDIIKIQEDIANNVADKLKLTLEAFQMLGGTENIKAYELYLNAKGKRAESNIAGYTNALDLLDSAIELDPEFAVAWAYKAHNHIMLSVFGPISSRKAELDDAQIATQKAIELEPNLADGYINLGINYVLKGKWIDAEQNISKAIKLIGDSLSGDYHFIIPFYNAVGKFKRALELLEETKRNDPLNPEFQSWYYETYSYLGDRKSAEEKYKNRNKLLLMDYETYHVDGITTARLSSGDILSKDEIVSTDQFSTKLKEYLNSPNDALAELHQIYRNEEYTTNIERGGIILWAAYFGDLDFVMEIIENTGNVKNSWIPTLHELRKTNEYKEFVRNIGLVDYWNKFGWPDLCRPVGDDDFVCE